MSYFLDNLFMLNIGVIACCYRAERLIGKMNYEKH